MRKFLLLAVLCLSVKYSQGQYAVVWQKIQPNGTVGEKEPREIFQVDNNSFILVYAENGSLGLEKIDLAGNIYWQIDYADSTGVNGLLNAFYNPANKTVTALCSDNDSIPINDFKNFDVNGHLQWSASFPENIEFATPAMLPNGNIVFNYINNWAVHVNILDTTGNIIPVDSFLEGNACDFEPPSPGGTTTIVPFKDNSFCAVYYENNGTGSYETNLMLFNSVPQIEYFQTFDTSSIRVIFCADTFKQIWGYQGISNGLISSKFNDSLNALFQVNPAIPYYCGAYFIRVNENNELESEEKSNPGSGFDPGKFVLRNASGQILKSCVLAVDSLPDQVNAGINYYTRKPAYSKSNGIYFFSSSGLIPSPHFSILSLDDSFHLKREYFAQEYCPDVFTVMNNNIIIAKMQMNGMFIERLDKTDHYKIKITEKFDVNNTCLNDSGDYNAGVLPVTINPGNLIVSTNQFGELYYVGDTGLISFDVSVPPLFSSACQPNPISVSADSFVQKDTTLLLTAPASACDLGVQLFQESAWPGFDSYGYIFITNDGTVPDSGQLIFKSDSLFSNFSFSVTPDSIHGPFCYFKINPVNPFAFTFISYTFHVPAIDTLGSPYTVSAVIQEGCSTFNAANDTSVASSNIIGSYDPNEIISSTKEGQDREILQQCDSSITYIVRFQNTGTDVAKNIFVKDTLSDLFDVVSFQHVASNYNCHFTIAGNVLTYFFDHIDLPDSTSDRAGSEGFFIYKIRFKPFVRTGPGYVIKSSASIYFDFNAPVKTSPVINYFDWIKTGTADQFYVSPNPSASQVLIGWARDLKINSLNILNEEGRELVSLLTDPELNYISVPVDHFRSGYYLISAMDPASGQLVHGRFVVAK